MLFNISNHVNNISKSTEKKINNAIDEKNNDLNDILPKISGKTSVITHNLSKIWDNISSSPSRTSKDARIAIDSNNNVHIVWVETIGSDDDVLYRMYNYTSKKFGPIYNVSDPNPLRNGNQSQIPDICVDQNNNVHITWNEQISGLSNNIYYRSFNYASKTWGKIIPISNTANDENYPSIACKPNGDVAITYSVYYGAPFFGRRIHVNYSSGGSWNSYEKLYFYATSTSHEDPDIIWDDKYGGNWYLTFVNQSTSVNQLLFQNKSDSNWTPPEEVASTGSEGIYYPELSIKNEIIFLTWQQLVDHGANDYLHVYSRNKTLTQTWSEVSGANDLSGNTLSNSPTKIFSTSQDSSGNLFLVYLNTSYGLDYKKYNNNSLEYKGRMSEDVNSIYPSAYVNSYDSFYCTWYSTSTNEIYMRKLDTYGPQLKVFSIHNNTVIRGILDLNISVFLRDIKSVNYTYWVDTNGDKIANDAGSKWISFYNWSQGRPYNEINGTWDTSNFKGKKLDIPHILISVKAIDENGLDEEYIFSNITIDNYKPQISELVNIYDSAGHNYSAGDTNFTYYGGGYIRFVFNAFDNNSGSGTYVTLYQGNNKITTNTSNNYFEISSGLLEGIYNFYINVSDGAGNWNSSNIILNIRIDNTPAAITIDNLVFHQEITNGYSIQISSTANDILYVNYSYYISNPTNQTFIGSKKNPSGTWNYIFNASLIEYEKITFIVNSTDFAGLHSASFIEIYVDNQEPSPVLVVPINDIGILNNFYLALNNDYTDNDTVEMKVYYREYGTGAYLLALNGYKRFTDLNRTIYGTNGTHYYVNFTDVQFDQLKYDWEYVDIQFRTTDNQGLTDILTLGKIKVQLDIPNKTKNIEVKINKYKITFTWEVEPGNDYLIYRSYRPFDIESINTMALAERILYLGDSPGEKYCIARIKAGTSNNYTDSVDGPNTYYYLFIAINQYNNPSEAVGKVVKIKIESTEKEILPSPYREWGYYFLGFLLIMAIITGLSIKRINRRFFKARVKITKKEIEKEMYVSFELEEKEGILEKKLPTDVKISTLKPSIEEPIVSFDKVEQEPKGTIEKCPTCGWILSSTATKCPRCGWVRH
ncbi:MAG: zinc ribbon domain-containing protein [Candidatus Helarchaeota archaeon]